MLCVPAVSAPVTHAAVRMLPLPASPTALQDEIEFPPSLELTEPVGLVPVTVAVKVTLAPAVDGLGELESVVVLAVAPPLLTVTVAALAVAPVTMMFTP